jgi:hypothetical protein
MLSKSYVKNETVVGLVAGQEILVQVMGRAAVAALEAAMLVGMLAVVAAADEKVDAVVLVALAKLLQGSSLGEHLATNDGLVQSNVGARLLLDYTLGVPHPKLLFPVRAVTNDLPMTVVLE